MGFDPVPWGVGGGALHTPEIFRVDAYLASDAGRGVLGPGDLKITQLGTPGASVQMAPGVALLPCRTSGYAYQSYIARAASSDTVGITATGAGAGRVDLVVARVEDPWLPTEPWADPVDPTVGPYVFLRVYSNVGAGSGTLPAVVTDFTTAEAFLAAQGSSAIPLALVTLPASTATVLTAHITDLRRMGKPRKDRRLYTFNPGGVVNLTSASFVDWSGSWSVDVPDWAVKAVIVARAGGARLDRSSVSVAGTATGQTRVRMGGSSGAPAVATQGCNYDLEATINNVVARFDVSAGDTITVPSALRGTTTTVAIQGLKSAGNKNLYVDTGSFVTVDIEFQEAPA